MVIVDSFYLRTWLDLLEISPQKVIGILNRAVLMDVLGVVYEEITYTEIQSMAILNQHENVESVPLLAREYGISHASVYSWRTLQHCSTRLLIDLFAAC